MPKVDRPSSDQLPTKRFVAYHTRIEPLELQKGWCNTNVGVTIILG